MVTLRPNLSNNSPHSKPPKGEANKFNEAKKYLKEEFY